MVKAVTHRDLREGEWQEGGVWRLGVRKSLHPVFSLYIRWVALHNCSAYYPEGSMIRRSFDVENSDRVAEVSVLDRCTTRCSSQI